MRQKLLLALLALFTLGGSNLFAQSWTGNEVAEGDFYLFNVGAQKYLNNGDPNESWGSNAYLQTGFGMDVTLKKISDGVYTIDTKVSNGGDSHYLASSTWTDAAATNWTFRAVEGETNVYQIIYDGQYLMANEALNDVEMVGDPDSRLTSTYWKLVSEDDFKVAMQAKAYSSTDPMDVSVFIKGRSFARNDTRNNSWVQSHNGGNWTWIGSSENKYFGNEAWNNTFDVHQDITGLPDGTYEVRCSGFGTNGTTYIYGNSKQGLLQTDNTTSYGTSKEAKWKAIHEDNAFAGQTTGTFAVGDGNLTVGIKRETNQSGDWAVWDEFRLYYYGLDLSEFAAALAEAVAAAEDLNGTIPSAAYEALNAIVTANNKTYSTVFDYTTATNSIIEATNNAGILQTPYNNYKTVRDRVVTLKSKTGFTDEGDAATSFDNAVTEQNSAVENATTTDGIQACIDAVRTAAGTFLGAVTITGTVDVTALIMNDTPTSNFDFWTLTGNATPDSNNNVAEYWNQSGVSIKQILFNLPKGSYTLTAVALARDGHIGTLTAGNNSMNLATVASSTVNNRDGANTWFNANNGVNILSFNLEDAENLEIGITADNANGDHWTVWRNFKLEYQGPTIANNAVELVEPMVADKWYYFDLAADGTYDLIATTINDIVYTNDGTILISNQSNVTTQFAGTGNQALTAGRYYVKSSSEQTFAITIVSYGYNVGEPVLSVADGGYTQTSTFTVTFPTATTNDPEGTITFMDGSKATVNDSEVILTAIEKGFSFNLGTLTPNTEYNIIIPSDVYGYIDKSMNEAINLTIHTPAVFDGYYFLRDEQGRYVGRGSSYNTRALMEPYGLPLHVETNGEGITTFTFIDSNQKLFDAGSGTVYTDNTTNPNWKVEATAGGYYIINKNNNGSFDKKLGTDGGTWMQSNDNGLVWTFEPASEHNIYMEALKDQQAVAAATAAGIEGITNRSSLEAKLASDYIPQTISIDDVAWNEKYQVSAGSEGAGNGVKYYENSKSSLKPGLYKLTVKAYYRLTWNETVEAAAGARGNVYLYGNNAKTQLYSVFDFPADAAWTSGNDYQDANGKYYPNNPNGSKAALNAGNYETELFVYVTADDGAETGTLNYGIHQPSRFGGNGQWCAYQDFTLTYFASKDDIAGVTEYDALNAAIEAAEAKTLGFEAEEYAPYNNIAALQALAAAKAIDQEATNSKKDVTDATTALTAATWNENTEEVNGIYDGFFAIQTVPSSNTKPLGWNRNSATANSTGYEDTGYQTRIVTIPNGVTASNVGMMTKMHAFYGDQESYTLPLKAETQYVISFKYAGYNDKPTVHINIYSADGTKVSNSPSFTTKDNKGHEQASSWSEFSYTFKTTVAGNYVIGLIKDTGATDQKQVVVTDIELFRVPTLNLSSDATAAPEAKKVANITTDRTLLDGLNTIVLPFNTTKEEIGATTVLEYTGTTTVGGTVTMNFKETETLEANVPYALMLDVAATEPLAFENKEVTPSDNLTITDENEQFNFVGTYVDIVKNNTIVSAGDYVAGATAFKKAKGGNRIAAFRAYLKKVGTGDAKVAFNFDGNIVDGIEALELLNKFSAEGIYNLQGQKVNNAQKGVYIVNGKKIVVK